MFSLEFSIPFLQITGPAGTGKTESVKALGHQLGRFVLVFNCDETFDLSEGRHKNKDTEKLYVDFVMQLVDYLRAKGKTVMMWADILLKHPNAIQKLPDDIQFLNWHLAT